MKPISTEEKTGTNMSSSVHKLAPVLLLAIGILILLLNNLSTTSLSISDTDPSTYVIAPMLMIVPFAVFMYKEGIIPQAKKRDISYGIALFLIFLLLSMYLQYNFPTQFENLKLSMLLFPIAIASFVTILFGLRNVKKFWSIMLYSIFASSIILTPLFSLNSQFASLNTQIIYTVLHSLYQNVTYLAPITIDFNGSLIGIGEACAGIGAIIAVVMFLAPVAYLYDGKLKNKTYWLTSSVILLFVLNLLRMSSITVLWIHYGLAATASFIHLFAGILVFYISIITMILIAGAYKINLPKEKHTGKDKVKYTYNYQLIGYGVVILLALIYFAGIALGV